MDNHAFVVFSAIVFALLLTGCAVSPAETTRRQAVEDEIAAILGEPLDPALYGEPKRCLTDRESRDFYALDDRRLVFEGPQDKLWLNTLPGRCPDLRWGDTLRVRSASWSRICELDSFVVADWFDWPWYRRGPLRSSSMAFTDVPCTLGKFQPVTRQQVDAIDNVLDRP